ncbi:GntR family transcriptional regulator [Roseateles cellulosilyticus]|uniref:GntR family transcriptional regulator n=1 Tax=Pelomonas cellulosilytica TaxID=2906762 RepID=A0ABS8XXD6_9BURK|nr:GntR family transcriptional regulator [Pelomonas sp. P8]
MTIPRKPETAEPGAASASQRVYLDLRRRILELEMPPGSRVVELEIAALHGVSRTPVHEAVQRLADEGLIDIVQRVGTFVSRIPVDELEEALLVRSALEVAIVEKVVARIDSHKLALLDDVLERERRCLLAGDSQSFHEADDAFHATLADIAGLPGVWRNILQVKMQIDRVRRLTAPIEGRMASTLEGHAEVLQALNLGDAELAKQAMRRHLDRLMPAIGITRAFRPDYFVNRALPAAGVA